MLTKSHTPTVVIICPGNGCNHIRHCNWYGHLYEQLTHHQPNKILCHCADFPDALHARRDRWVPHIHQIVQQYPADSRIVLVGHSSGAQAVLRYTEEYATCTTAILVAATYSDLDNPHERASGYYPVLDANQQPIHNPYQFDKMRQNCPQWFQFHSDNDPFIPLAEAERIRKGLDLVIDKEYFMLPGRSHFFEPFPDLLETILKLC
jgi:uncharacterized protein